MEGIPHLCYVQRSSPEREKQQTLQGGVILVQALRLCRECIRKLHGCEQLNCYLSHHISIQSVTDTNNPPKKTTPPHHTLRNKDISHVISIRTVHGSEMKSTIQGIAFLHDIWIPTGKWVWQYWVSLFLSSQYLPNKAASVSEPHNISVQLLSLPAWTWQLRWVTERSHF